MSRMSRNRITAASSSWCWPANQTQASLARIVQSVLKQWRSRGTNCRHGERAMAPALAGLT
jgi:hypothetical protein